ncbi:GDSL esterase/lipase EXL3-like isoform X2 [Lycium barbarum]|uniref:GDSL esterase/lipase EXL3-like isoform X2 n=1 Tax=Lycium barbarum TaxID=112863 RepID=UPI00293E201F|nr:GDSL esterase/lipase EXL3-like isoform X2 [Lycium barbarum]
MLYVLYAVCVFFSVCSSEAKVKLPANVVVPAVFAFGDSIVDQGNNNNIGTPIKCNFPPYGKDLMDGTPTGRFSNAKTPPDLLAEELGIKGLVPAYLDPNLRDEDLKTGVSFASGGCGYDPLTASSMELFKLGARRIGLMGIPPIGCLPMQRTLLGGIIARGCVEEHNEAAQLANTKMAVAIDLLSKTLPKSKLVFIDIYDLVTDFIVNHKKYGFEEVKKGCCGSGNIEVGMLCNKYSATCEDDTKYLFWDSFHPTEKGYRVLVDQIIKNNMNKIFKTTV